MFLPTALAGLLLMLVVIGTWVSAILNSPEMYVDAPRIIQNFTRSLYWQARTDWQGIPECAQFDPVTLYRPRPGQCRFRNAEFDTVMRFDFAGARATAGSAANPGLEKSAVRRAIVLGDSFAMGWGVSDSDAFAAFLASEHNVPAVNLGVSSYGTARELLRLQDWGALAPNDVLVIQYCDNDYEENLHFSATGRVGPYTPADLEPIQQRQPVAARPLPLAGRLLRLMFRQLLDTLKTRGSDVPSPSMSPAAAFLAVLDSFPDVRRHRIFIVPINEHGRISHLFEDRTLIESAGLSLVVPALKDDSFFPLDGHLTPEGHRLVAASVAGAIAASGQVQSTSAH